MILFILLSIIQTWKKAQAPQACLGNILDGWGTFWTKIYAVLSHLRVCPKLRIFHKVFKVKMGTLSPKKGVMTHWWSKYLRYNHYTMYIIKIWMKLYHKSWFTHICRDFWKCQFHAFWGTFWNPQSLRGEHTGTFFMSAAHLPLHKLAEEGWWCTMVPPGQVSWGRVVVHHGATRAS